MKLKLDENIGRRGLELLKAAGHVVGLPKTWERIRRCTKLRDVRCTICGTCSPRSARRRATT